MIKKLSCLLLLLLAGRMLWAQQQRQAIYFDKGSSVLSSKSKTQLKALAAGVAGKAAMPLTLGGYADTQGDTAYNLALSKKRAQAVFDFLAAQGVAKTTMQLQFYGERKATAAGSAAQQNRRVDILIGHQEADSGLRKWPHRLRLSAGKMASGGDIRMTGDGIALLISLNDLCRQNGGPTQGDVDIEVRTYYKKSDMLLDGLHTLTSDGQLLETGGMVYITARCCGGEELKLKEGGELLLGFPGKKDVRMRTFTGAKEGHTINWQQQAATTSVIVSEFKGGYRGYDSLAAKKLFKLENIFLKSNSLGWINCDRFVDVGAKSSLVVQVDTACRPMVRLVFKSMKAIMPAYYDANGSIVLRGLPVGQKATLVVFGFVGETEACFASQELVIGSDQKTIQLKLAKTTLAALRVNLQKLD